MAVFRDPAEGNITPDEAAAVALGARPVDICGEENAPAIAKK